MGHQGGAFDIPEAFITDGGDFLQHLVKITGHSDVANRLHTLTIIAEIPGSAKTELPGHRVGAGVKPGEVSYLNVLSGEESSGVIIAFQNLQLMQVDTQSGPASPPGMPGGPDTKVGGSCAVMGKRFQAAFSGSRGFLWWVCPRNQTVHSRILPSKGAGR